jgi:murein DD-endopeptidase MepM/ murein hydrolase activator NlpD
MSSISVKVGEDVRPGDKLGEVGNTGHSTGPHLHLEIHPDGGPAVDPQRWLAAHGLAI